MQLRYDEDFIEAAAFLCTSGRRKDVPSLQIARFHREREKLYAILDPDEPHIGFQRRLGQDIACLAGDGDELRKAGDAQYGCGLCLRGRHGHLRAR